MSSRESAYVGTNGLERGCRVNTEDVRCGDNGREVSVRDTTTGKTSYVLVTRLVEGPTRDQLSRGGDSCPNGRRR